jgi:hypothetical protein
MNNFARPFFALHQKMFPKIFIQIFQKEILFLLMLSIMSRLFLNIQGKFCHLPKKKHINQIGQIYQIGLLTFQNMNSQISKFKKRNYKIFIPLQIIAKKSRKRNEYSFGNNGDRKIC